MENCPFISIVLICYNYGHLLPRTLQGIKAQTFRDFELVFVDNGCTDNSVDLVREFMKDNPEIPVNIVTVEKNIGLAHGDNIGSAAAKGKYMLLHDADDWMDDNTLELLARKAMETDADRVIGSFRDVNDDGKVVKIRSVGKNPVMWLHTMQQANLFRTDIYHKNNIKLECFWVDAEKTMRFSQYVKKVAFVQQDCYNYLVHTDSFSHKELYKRLDNENESLDLLLRKYRAVYNALEEQEDREWQEYQATKIYFFYSFQYLREAPLKIIFQKYEKLRDTMRRYYPHYLKNKKITLFGDKGDSTFSKIVTWNLCMVERLHLMKLLLAAYHLLGKITYLHI